MSLCIGLCVYGSEFGLPYVFKNIERIQTLFQEKIQVVVAYAESPDCSLGFLISKLPEFDIHILKNPNAKSNTKSTIHVENIANARNQILEHIRSKFTDTKYLIMMDTNEYACIGDIQLETLSEVLNPDKEKEWDAVSFDREAGYYDYGALSFDPFIYTNDDLKPVEKMREYVGNLLEKAKQTPNDFITVYSAFNGFAIYKWSVFQECNYSSTDDCEHRHFHLQAIRDKNARIRIYPKSLFSIFKGEKIKNCRGLC